MATSIPVNDLLQIRKSIISTGKTLKRLLNSRQSDLFAYQMNNMAGHKSLGIDLKAEDLLVEAFNSAGLRGQVISEERGIIPLESNDGIYYTFIVDPLDGSTNFRRGIPFNCISVAYMPDMDEIYLDQLENGIIYDFNSGNLYEVRDNQAFVNDDPMKMRQSAKPRTICYYYYSSNGMQQKLLSFERNFRIRTLGCAALELVHVATGGFDGFIDVRGGLGTYDFAVAAKILELMGASVTYLVSKADGQEEVTPSDILLNDLQAGYKLVASQNKEFHDSMLESLKYD